jgi:RNA polymerase sigma factor (TIGR02999 family)
LASEQGDVTLLLGELRQGHRDAEAKLFQLVYDELHRLAKYYMRGERPGHSLQATALVHEAYLRLTRINDVDWQGRSHFFAVSAQAMRRILVDHARARCAERRGGPQEKVSLDEALVVSFERPEQFIALDEALNRLAEFDARQARIVELRFFGGLSEEETAAVLGISARTVKRDWQMAKAWLLKELGG